ncbi:Kdo(2)-lipid IV(A) acyltransferase [Spirabiliibacterium falconis]|uniref:Kdo(2)-lipid IV(A) acyltransferase n=1 Tax=Spirabiliibacterium falconis TaxID=572023 RepID=UPI001AACB404|nr:Kdo(2)-lipid IV(A) acyltransferase [Spirabiliibacterium falconis]MBE2893688.1 LpxL/LpxP family Kdo(2)-lipid IV(A) lauroyl/palmitoleoyl acyltransferasee [Spirabiliibacterium falconis]
MTDKHRLPPFKIAFLHPRYWFLWLGFGLFRLVLLLPYPILLKLGYGISWLFIHLNVGKRRANIARRNLELAFPQKSVQEREQILTQNIRSVGMAIIETGMAWFWSDARIKKWSSISGLEHLKKHRQGGIIFVGVHFLTLELGARIIGLVHPGVGVYRPNDNPVFDWIQYRGRIRSNKMLLDRKDLRGILKALKNNETVWYAPDHDYGRKNAVFVPFFGVPDAATTTGSYYLIKANDEVAVVPFAPLRKHDGSGYHVSISEPVTFPHDANKEQVATQMNQVVEREIEKDITQYMWLHRRFKTRPNDTMPSYYQ